MIILTGKLKGNLMMELKMNFFQSLYYLFTPYLRESDILSSISILMSLYINKNSTEKQTFECKWLEHVWAMFLLVQHYYHYSICLDVFVKANCKSSCFSLDMEQLIRIQVTLFFIAQLRIERFSFFFFYKIRECPHAIKTAPLHFHFVLINEV